MKSKLRALASLAAVFMTVSILWYGNRPLVIQPASFQDVVQEAHGGGYRLIDVEDLWQQYQHASRDLLLVDTRQVWEYRTGHIKGAVNFPLEPTLWSRWRQKGALEKFLGPDRSRILVFY
ncbi:rhodanese-like domain-containing protein [bacterium]|nr:rhodanese-like domain-containing protein [bacterium]